MLSFLCFLGEKIRVHITDNATPIRFIIYEPFSQILRLDKLRCFAQFHITDNATSIRFINYTPFSQLDKLACFAQ